MEVSPSGITANMHNPLSPFPINVNHVREEARKANDPRAALDAMKDWNDDERSDLTKLCQIPFDYTRTSPLRIEVYTRLISLFPVFNLLPGPQTEANIDFFYAPIRLLLASAGYEAHDILATALLSVDPSAPFDAQQTKEQWVEEIHAAHQMCGLPITLPLVSFHRLLQLCNKLNPSANIHFLTPIVALHILKHTRLTRTDVRVLYHSQANYLHHDSTDLDEKQMRFVRQMVGSSLGLVKPKGMKKGEGRAYDVANGVLQCCTASSFLYAKSKTLLPPSILWGTFSGIEPAKDVDDFTEAGFRLTDVWEGTQTKEGHVVRRIYGREDSIFAFAWNIAPLGDEVATAREIFLAGIPTTYEKKLPADIMLHYFPNIALDWADRNCLLAIYDAMLACSVVRYYRRVGMREEFPMLWILPAMPTPAAATNNGKTYLAKALATVTMPSLQLRSVMDSDSAPDSRAIQTDIEIDGTLALDDWVYVTSKKHILYKDTLQSITVGIGHKGGKVLENGTDLVYLKENILVNAKCVDLPPDLENRSVFIYMNPLKTEDRADREKAAKVMSGKAAMEIRLASDLWVNALALDRIPPIGVGDYRFPVLFSLMLEFAKVRGVPNPAEDLWATMQRMFRTSRTHYQQAEDSGLAALAEGSDTVRVRLTDLFHDLTHLQLETLRAEMGNTPVTAARFLRLRLECLAAGIKSLRVMLGEIGIQIPAKAKDRQISLTFEGECAGRMPNTGDTYRIVGTAIGIWHMKRETKNGYVLEFETVTPFAGAQ